MQGGQEKSIDSELTEILQVAEVDLKVGNQNVTFSPATTNSCPRCRRYTLLESHDLCNRCESVVAKLVSYDSNCCSYFLKEFQNFMDFKKENFFGQVKINS